MSIQAAPFSLGPVAPNTVKKVEITVTEEEKARQERIASRPPLDEILNLHDFEVRLMLSYLLYSF